MKKIASLFMVILMTFSFMPWSVFAEDDEAVNTEAKSAASEENEETESTGEYGIVTGKCGRQMTYSYNEETRVLTLSGKGDPYEGYDLGGEVGEATKVVFVDYSSEKLPSFSGFGSLTSITIPECVIEGGNFYECSSLKEVNLPSGLQSGLCFWGCSKLETVKLPNTYHIYDGAFQYWSGLKHIEIPEGITHIGWYCFSNCKNLETITLPQSLVSCDYYLVFSHCEKLKKVVLPLAASSISYECFTHCLSLEEVLIPTNVTSIASNAFDYCDKVTIVGAKGSYAEQYAKKVGIPFKEHNHNYGEWTVISEANCTEEGSRERVCSGCGDTVTETIPATGDHDYGEWEITKEANCTDAGSREKVCSNCYDLVTETIPALGHDYDSNNVCKRCGYREYVIDENNIRIFGDTRYDTAKNVATKYREISEEGFENVIIASGSNFPDALSGGYLAKVKNAPIFLVDSSAYGAREMAIYIRSIMKGSGGTVYILGGSGAVSDNLDTHLNAYRIKVKRLGGKDRYETNLRILREAGVDEQDILVCTGNGYADSLSASAVGKPILLVGSTISDAQKEYIKGLNTKQFYLIGGEGVVGKKIQTDLKKLNSSYSVERLWGQSRYETSTAVARKFFPKAKTVILAYAQNFPDGLSGGPLAMKKNAPIVLTDTRTTAAAKSYIKSAGAVQSITLGGPALISDAAVKAIMGR